MLGVEYPVDEHGKPDEAALDAWLEPILANADGEPLGVRLDTCPYQVWRTLRWAGVPFAKGGGLCWGTDLLPDSDDRPEIDEQGVLHLPAADQMRDLSSLALKPVRRFIAERLKVRLQAATDLSMTLWSNQALLVSTCGFELGGFLHGPGKGQRSSLNVAAGPSAGTLLNVADETPSYCPGAATPWARAYGAHLAPAIEHVRRSVLPTRFRQGLFRAWDGLTWAQRDTLVRLMRRRTPLPGDEFHQLPEVDAMALLLSGWIRWV